MPKALIIDHGAYTNLAERLGAEMGVAYWSSNLDAYPSSRETSPGVGLKGVERIDDPLAFMLAGKASHVIVPDLYLGGFEQVAHQLELPVFGSGEGQRLETDREFMLDFLAEHKLPVPEGVVIEGITELGEYLKGKNDLYVKVSTYRGDLETEHFTDWDAKQPWYDRLKVRLGPIGERIKFIVQEPIKSVCEVGIDTYFRDGEFVVPMIAGWEIKDAGYVGRKMTGGWGFWPNVMDPLASALGDGYNTFFSNEMRITKDGTVYMTDATCRVPSPPGGVMMWAAQNFADVVLKGASPDYGDAEWFCEIVLKSNAVATDYVRLKYPKSHHYAFHSHCVIDGNTWIVPHPSWSYDGKPYVEFGSALGWGKSLEDADAMAREAAEALEGDGVRFDAHVLEKAEEEMEKGKSVGL